MSCASFLKETYKMKRSLKTFFSELYFVTLSLFLYHILDKFEKLMSSFLFSPTSTFFFLLFPFLPRLTPFPYPLNQDTPEPTPLLPSRPQALPVIARKRRKPRSLGL